MVFKVLIDQGNSVYILHWKTFPKLEVSPNTIHLHAGPLLDFASERVETRDYVDLMTTFGQGKLFRSFTIRYLLVDANTSYFALIDRKTLNELGAIVFTPHLPMKFPTLTSEIVTVKVDQKQVRQCYVVSLKVAPYPSIRELVMLDSRRRGLKPIEELVQLQLGPKSGKCTRLNWDLTNHEHRCIPDVLHRNADLFTWSLSDMSGIHPDIIYHKLAICPRPNLYHRRKGKPERSGVKSSKKKSKSSSMQTSSERACPKDAYPLHNTDRLVDGASRYNHIRMHPPDEEKMKFITENANFCYRVIPFNLKNEEVFKEIRKYNKCVNHEKCTFEVGGGKFLGFISHIGGLKPTPTNALPYWRHSAQSTYKKFKISTLASLSKFLPKLVEKVKPFYKLLKKTEPFSWDETYEQAFVKWSTSAPIHPK
ncbi:hypothetical protein AAZX31_02G120600 [Glycine max]